MTIDDVVCEEVHAEIDRVAAHGSPQEQNSQLRLLIRMELFFSDPVKLEKLAPQCHKEAVGNPTASNGWVYFHSDVYDLREMIIARPQPGLPFQAIDYGPWRGSRSARIRHIRGPLRGRWV